MALQTNSVQSGDDAGEVSTFGWDTAFAIRVDNVNAAIRNQKVSPPSFFYTLPTDSKVFCKGTFSDWQVVRGGDGGGVNLLLPFRNVTGQMKFNCDYVAYQCSEASLTVTVRLKYFDIDQSTTSKQLMVSPTSTSPDQPAVEVYSPNFPAGSVQPASAVYALQAAVVAWCQANIADFKHVFSIVDLNDEADQGAWSFLKPTAVSYAYVDGPTDEDAFLGVLAVTQGNSPDSLQQVLDTRIVQTGEEGAFCISQTLLLKKLIFPNLQSLWPNLKKSQVTFSENSIQLNANTSISLPQTEYQGTYYTPQLQQFTLTIDGSQLSIDAYTVTDEQDGVQAWCRSENRYTIVKGTNSQGQTTLAYQKLPSPDPSHGHNIAEWVEITDIILAIVLGIALAALTILTDGAAAVIVGIVGALIVGTIALSPQIEGLIQNNDAPAVDLLQANISGPVTWTDSKDFTISSVTLDGAIRLGGLLGFGTLAATA